MVVAVVIVTIAAMIPAMIAAAIVAVVVVAPPLVHAGRFSAGMAGGMASLLAGGIKADPEVFDQVIADATGAILIVVAMTFGLVIPKICLAQLSQSLLTRRPKAES